MTCWFVSVFRGDTDVECSSADLPRIDVTTLVSRGEICVRIIRLP